MRRRAPVPRRRRPRAVSVDDGAGGRASGVVLRGDRASELLLGGAALSARPACAPRAGSPHATGARLMAETFPARVECGGGCPLPPRLPYFPEQARAALAGARRTGSGGRLGPVAFFGYPGEPSSTVPAGVVTRSRALAGPAAGRGRCAGAAGGGRGASEVAARATPAVAGAAAADADAPLTPETAPASSRRASPRRDRRRRGRDHERVLRAGRRRAAPRTPSSATWRRDRRPPAPRPARRSPPRTGRSSPLQADGSGLYTAQALWTQAREGLDVTALVCANGAYRILQVELARAGQAQRGAVAAGLTDLDDPRIDCGPTSPTASACRPGRSPAPNSSPRVSMGTERPGPHLLQAVLLTRQVHRRHSPDEQAGATGLVAFGLLAAPSARRAPCVITEPRTVPEARGAQRPAASARRGSFQSGRGKWQV